jgi:hypothetical protein
MEGADHIHRNIEMKSRFKSWHLRSTSPFDLMDPGFSFPLGLRFTQKFKSNLVDLVELSIFDFDTVAPAPEFETGTRTAGKEVNLQSRIFADLQACAPAMAGKKSIRPFVIRNLEILQVIAAKVVGSDFLPTTTSAFAKAKAGDHAKGNEKKDQNNVVRTHHGPAA